jgi:hypothetical protein
MNLYPCVHQTKRAHLSHHASSLIIAPCLSYHASSLIIAPAFIFFALLHRFAGLCLSCCHLHLLCVPQLSPFVIVMQRWPIRAILPPHFDFPYHLLNAQDDASRRAFDGYVIDQEAHARRALAYYQDQVREHRLTD